MTSTAASTLRSPRPVRRVAVATHGTVGAIGPALERLRRVASEAGVECLYSQEVITKHGLPEAPDDPSDGRKWLASNGDPYKTSIVDRDGRVGIDFGVYGVPETFVIDKSGIIRYKQIGPLTPQALDSTILPLVRKLRSAGVGLRFASIP